MGRKGSGKICKEVNALFVDVQMQLSQKHRLDSTIEVSVTELGKWWNCI